MCPECKEEIVAKVRGVPPLGSAANDEVNLPTQQ